MDQTESGDRFRTSDFYFAAFLKTAGVPFMETTREASQEGSRTFFVFERVDGIRDLKNQYYSRSAKVVALTYADEIRTMKALTYGE